jgi:hypothetical protein
MKKDWAKAPTGPGLYWVYHVETAHVSTASVYKAGDGLRVRMSGLERTFGVDELLGRLLFFPANVPPPPARLVQEVCP